MKVVAFPTDKYPPRTAHNARTGDLTIAFAEDFESLGEIRTKKAVVEARKIYLPIHLQTNKRQASIEIFRICRDNNVSVINIAGNGIYSLKEHGWTQESLNQWVYDVLKPVCENLPIVQIVSGGQTGVDFAGGVAGEVLGLNPVMTFPKGFLQRTLSSYAYTQTEENVLKTVEQYVKKINK